MTVLQPNEIICSLNITVTDDDTGSETPPPLFWEKLGDGPNPNQIQLALFPNGDTFTSSGTLGIGAVGGLRLRFVDTLLVMNNSSSASLQHGGVGSISVSQIGSFLNSNGQVISANISYNPQTGVISFDRNVTGILRLQYNAPFTQFTYTFDGIGCPATLQEQISRPVDPTTGFVIPYFNEAVCFATYNPHGVIASASIQVSNPDTRCPTFVAGGGSEPTAISAAPTIHPRMLVQEVNSKLAGLNVTGLGTSTTLRVYPDLNASYSVSRGTIKSVTSKIENNVADALTFSGQSTLDMKIPVATLLTATPVGVFFDQFGQLVSVTANKPGDVVTPAVWTASGVSEVTGSPLTVKAGEVILTRDGRTIPAYGQVVITYNATYEEVVYDHQITLDTVNKQMIAESAFVSVKNGGFAQVHPINKKIVSRTSI